MRWWLRFSEGFREGCSVSRKTAASFSLLNGFTSSQNFNRSSNQNCNKNFNQNCNQNCNQISSLNFNKDESRVVLCRRTWGVSLDGPLRRTTYWAWSCASTATKRGTSCSTWLKVHLPLHLGPARPLPDFGVLPEPCRIGDLLDLSLGTFISN